MGGYNPKKENISYYLNHVSKVLDKHIINYENMILLGDFNASIIDDTTTVLCQMYNHQNMMLSDHHKITVTVLKSYFKKKEPININYSCYTKINENLFRIELINLLRNSYVLDYEEFKKIFMQFLNIHAPMKKKFIRGNNAPFMNKTLSKAFTDLN